MFPLQEIHATNGHDLFKMYYDFVHKDYGHILSYSARIHKRKIAPPHAKPALCAVPQTKGIDPIAARSPLLCPALRRNRTKQRSAAIKRRERLPFDRGAAALQALRLLKLKCSLPQCDSFFKGPFSISGAQKADFTLKNPAFCVQTIQKRMHSGRTASQAPLA